MPDPGSAAASGRLPSGARMGIGGMVEGRRYRVRMAGGYVLCGRCVRRRRVTDPETGKIHGPFHGDESIGRYASDVGEAYEKHLRSKGYSDEFVKPRREAFEQYARHQARAYSLQSLADHIGSVFGPGKRQDASAVDLHVCLLRCSHGIIVPMPAAIEATRGGDTRRAPAYLRMPA